MSIDGKVVAPQHRGIRAVALLEVEPTLARYIAQAELDHARRTVKLRLVTLGRGPFSADAVCRGQNPFGALIVSGLVAHELRAFDHTTRHLLGPGDFIFADGPTAT